jgi:type VI secretion system protein ImpD
MMVGLCDETEVQHSGAAIDRLIAAIDAAVSRQLDAILHHPEFQRLEAAWRGLQWLVRRIEPGNPVLIKLLHAAWAEVCRDLGRAQEFDQSALFNLVYEQEFGSAGGRPYGLLVGLYEVRHQRTEDHRTDDVGALRSLAEVAAAAFSPLIVSATPSMFGLESWRGLGRHLDLSDLLRDPAYQRWSSLGAIADARFLGVALPRILLRKPYDAAKTFTPDCYDEIVEHSSAMLWGHPGFAVAAVVIRAFESHRWFADIRGMPQGSNGGFLEGLPLHGSDYTEMPPVPQSPVEVMLTESQDRQLQEAGFIPLSPARFTGGIVLYGNQSVRQPEKFSDPDAGISERLSSMLQYVLCVSRFAHHIKVMLRDRVGSIATPGAIEGMLNEWLNRYSNANDNASPEMKARYPLSSAAATVQEHPADPGRMLCEVRLQPRFQLDYVDAAFSIATEIRAREKV